MLKKHGRQGLMSTVHTVRSNQGELVVHIISPAQEWIRQRIWEKLPAAASLLENYPEIPSAVFIAAGDKDLVVYKVLRDMLARETAVRPPRALAF